MKSRSKLAAIIGGIVGGSLLAFCCAMLFTVMVIMPARGPAVGQPEGTGEPVIQASPSLGIGPIPGRTPGEPAPTPTYAVIILSPEPSQPTAIGVPSVTTTAGTPVHTPTRAPSPTPTSGLPFYYVEGSRLEEVNCFSQYLAGWVRDANGAPLNGVVVRWQYWNNTEFATSGDPQQLWQPGEWKFTYYGDRRTETEFVLQIVENEQNPQPLSERLEIHYAGCGLTGQITNIVFKRR